MLGIEQEVDANTSVDSEYLVSGTGIDRIFGWGAH
jgi:hypothetical protein